MLEAQVISDDERALSPSLMPPDNAWRSDAAESPDNEEPEVKYLDVTRHKWIMKYNALLQRCQRFERVASYEKIGKLLQT